MLLVALILLVLAHGAAQPPGARAEPRLLMVGDSLAIDTESHLRRSLPGWDVRVRAWFGLRLDQGLRLIDDDAHPPRIVAFSLFTNDAPDDAAKLERAVVRTLRRHAGCHIWATLYVRAPRGNPFAAANRRLRALARRHPRRLVVVDWAATTARTSGLIRPDGIHTTAKGARARAALYAGAARRCLRRQAP
jgi:hypothetical protein